MSMLSGIRILAVEQYGAGPFGTSYLAAMGAEVIKVEQPHERGDVTRHLGPYYDSTLPDTAQSLFYQSLNYGKKSLSLNLGSEQGRELFRQLAGTADAVISNLRGDVPQRLGLTYGQLADANPKIVCGHLTGYGREGERAHWPGYDFLMQAETGYFSLTGEPDSPPARMGVSMIDYMTGAVMSLGLVSGILKARETGAGCDVDVSLFDVALHNLNYLAAWHLNAGAMPTRQPRSAHPSMVPCQLYRTADGWIYLMCNKEKFWHALCAGIGREDLATNPDFLTFKERLINRDALTALLDEILGQRSTADWMTAFAGSVPAAPVHSMAQALAAPFANADGRIANVAGTSLRAMRSPILSSSGEPELTGAPAFGEHTAEILAAMGVDPGAQATLKADGII